MVSMEKTPMAQRATAAVAVSKPLPEGKVDQFFYH
jgi:hypothetical protein